MPVYNTNYGSNSQQNVIKTLDDIINKNDRYDINKITMYTATDGGELIIKDTDLFATYMRFIWPYARKYRVSDYQRRYYRCRPHLLSYDVYGTPELVWLIIMLNDQECPSKFRMKATVNLIPVEQLSVLWDTILTRSNDELQANWNKYLPQVIMEDDSDS